jgi:hypothetical protein
VWYDTLSAPKMNVSSAPPVFLSVNMRWLTYGKQSFKIA